MIRVLTYIWARFCELRAEAAMDDYISHRMGSGGQLPGPASVRDFERRTHDAWQRREKWHGRAEKYFSKLGLGE